MSLHAELLALIEAATPDGADDGEVWASDLRELLNRYPDAPSVVPPRAGPPTPRPQSCACPTTTGRPDAPQVHSAMCEHWRPPAAGRRVGVLSGDGVVVERAPHVAGPRILVPGEEA